MDIGRSSSSRRWLRNSVGRRPWPSPGCGARIKPYETTYGEALQQLANPAAYKLDRWTWAYKEFEGSAEQADLRIVHIFTFIPKGQDTVLQVAPVKVEIAAQLDMTEATIDK